MQGQEGGLICLDWRSVIVCPPGVQDGHFVVVSVESSEVQRT